MVISQMGIERSLGKRSIGNNHSVFANDISGKYKRAGGYAYNGVSLTFLLPKQDAGARESSVHIAYQLMLQELYFLTHNTMIVNQKEILQGIAFSLERQIELVRKENSAEAVRLEQFVRQVRETSDRERLLQIGHEIEEKLGINRIVQTENGHSSIIDRYVAGLQSMAMADVSQSEGADTQETLLEQQRDLLSRIYAESTHQEKEEFASFLEENRLLYKTTGKAVKELENRLHDEIVEQAVDILRDRSIRESMEKSADSKTIKEYETRLHSEIVEQAAAEPEERTIQEVIRDHTDDKIIKERVTGSGNEIVTKEMNAFNNQLAKETTEWVTNEHKERSITETTGWVTNEHKERSITMETTEWVPNGHQDKLITTETTEWVPNGHQDRSITETTNEAVNKAENLLANVRTEDQMPGEPADHADSLTKRTTDSALAAVVADKTAKFFEMLQTVDETQFHKMQQAFMETYETQQFTRLMETEESQIDVIPGLTHRQKKGYRSIIDHYFAGLQSMIVTDMSPSKRTDTQELFFEQQRNLLSRVYAESTQQEKEEFVSYLEENRLLYRTNDKAVKELENRLHDEIVEQAVDILRDRSIRESMEKSADSKTIKEYETRLHSEIVEQAAAEPEDRFIQEVIRDHTDDKIIKERVTGSGSEIVTKEMNAFNNQLATETTEWVTNGHQDRPVTMETTEWVTNGHQDRSVTTETTEWVTNGHQDRSITETTDETVNKTENLLANARTEDQMPGELADHADSKTIRTKDSDLAAIVADKTAKVFEMLQTVDETQFQKMQQAFMETYETQQFTRLMETEESQIDVIPGLTHRQRKGYRSIIDRYFAGLQSMIVTDTSQSERTDTQELFFEQQRNLLSRVYAESTQQEREEFASYLEENRLLYKTTDKAVKELETRLHDEIADQAVNILEDRSIKETMKESADSKTIKEYETRLRSEIVDLAAVVADKTAKVFEMLQTVDETQFLEMQQVFMEIYEKQQLSRLTQTEEHQVSTTLELTHRQKEHHDSVINRYFTKLQSVVMTGVSRSEKADVQRSIFEQQRNLLRQVYAESTRQEKEEFAAYLEENQLLYQTADQTIKGPGTRLHSEIADQITNAIENRQTKETIDRITVNKAAKEAEARLVRKTTDQVTDELKRKVINEIGDHQTGVTTELTHIQNMTRSSIADRYVTRLQSMLVSGTVHTGTAALWENVSKLQTNILSTIYAESTGQEKEEFARYFGEPELLYKIVKKADPQQTETKIQEIVEHCVKRTTRVTESETVRKQINDQQNEIARLKAQVLQQHEQMDTLLKNDSRMPNMDRVYQEIEKRMESRLHLERLRRGM